MKWFRNRIEAKVVIEDWRVYCSTVRPQSSLSFEAMINHLRTIQPPAKTIARKIWFPEASGGIERGLFSAPKYHTSSEDSDDGHGTRPSITAA